MFPLKDTIRARGVPFVNYAIIAVNLLVFALEATLGPRQLQSFIFSFGLIPRQLFAGGTGEVFTVLTSMFVHGGWFHVLSNMWALFIFGDNVEIRLGHGRYLFFYLLCGVAAALTQALLEPSSPVPVVGASGAIAGVMGAYVLAFPHSRIVTLIPVFFIPWFVEIPALLFIGFWFLSQLFSGVFALAGGAAAASGIAWWAHVGGFGAGILLLGVLGRRRSGSEWPTAY